MSQATESAMQLGDALAPATTAGRKLFDDLRGAIETGRLRDGDRIAPIRELAAKYKIAFDTARATVGQLEKLALLRRRRGAGTFVTTRIPSGESFESNVTAAQTVGLLIDSKAHVFDHLTADLIDLLQRQGLASIKFGWRYDAGIEQIGHLLRVWRRQPPRAVVVQTGPHGLEREIDEACGGKTAIVLAFRGSDMPATRFSSVNPDYDAAYRLAAQTLLDRGHRRIGLVTTPRNIRPEAPYTLRKRTMDHTRTILDLGQMLRERGIQRPGLTLYYNSVTGSNERTGIASPENIERCVRWLQRARPTAVIGNDFRLVVVCRAAESLGLRIGTGRDFELIGVGDTPWAHALGFESVSLREELIARHVATLITNQLQTPGEATHHIVVAPKLLSGTPAAG